MNPTALLRAATAAVPPSAVVLADLLLASTAGAQNDFSDVRITTVPVAGTVSMLQGAGGNIGVSAGPDGLLIVDDQFAPLAERIRAALDALAGPGRTGAPRFVLNTHFHGDHTGGNASFGKDGTIIAQENVRTRLMTPRDVLGRHEDPAPAEALPIITFRNSVTLHWNGEEIRVIHLPAGHTDGDSIVWFTASNVVHLGDDYFAGKFPLVDLDHGGDVLGYMRNVDTLVAHLPGDARLIPGHGPLSTMDDLRAYQKMLQATIGIVQGRMLARRTLEQIQAEGLPAQWKDWGTGFISTEHWLQIVHDSLERSPDGPPPGTPPDFGPPPAAGTSAPAPAPGR